MITDNFIRFLKNNEQVLQTSHNERPVIFVKVKDEELNTLDIFHGSLFNDGYNLTKFCTIIPSKNTIVISSNCTPMLVCQMYGVPRNDMIVEFDNVGFKVETIDSLAENFYNKYASYVEKTLKAEYPDFKSIEHIQPDYNTAWYNAQGKRNLLYNTIPILKFDTPSEMKGENEKPFVKMLVEDNEQKVIENCAERLKAFNVRQLFEYYALLKAMDENKLTDEEKEVSAIARKILNYVDKHDVKSITMVYNTKPLLEKANEITNREDYQDRYGYSYHKGMRRIIHYLSEHKEIEFKVKKDYGSIVNASVEEFINTYNTNIKSVFKLDRYDTLPREIENMLENSKYMKDCLYRGKSIL